MKGIIQMIQQLNPLNVVFVHGEKQKIYEIKNFVEEKMNVKAFTPDNH